jgi:hypothetical protein
MQGTGVLREVASQIMVAQKMRQVAPLSILRLNHLKTLDLQHRTNHRDRP